MKFFFRKNNRKIILKHPGKVLLERGIRVYEWCPSGKCPEIIRRLDNWPSYHLSSVSKRIVAALNSRRHTISLSFLLHVVVKKQMKTHAYLQTWYRQLNCTIYKLFSLTTYFFFQDKDEIRNCSTQNTLSQVHHLGVYTSVFFIRWSLETCGELCPAKACMYDQDVPFCATKALRFFLFRST